MNILRYCKHCGVEFIAHKITTQYCCKECERKESRHREKIKKQKDSLMQNGDADSPERILANSMEFLSPSQAAALLGVSRATIYRYAVDGVIKAVQLKGITIIRRSDIDTFFNEAPAYKKRVSRRKKKEADSEYYSTREIQEKYHICRKAILARCDKYNIPKVYEGRNTFFKKVHVDARFAELLEPIDLDNYYTISQVQERLNMNNKQNVLSFVYRHDIPRITRGRDVYYSKVHIDNFKRKGSEADANWYTYAEIIEKFGFTKDQITKYIHCSNKIKTEKRGKYTMIYRSQFDKLIIEKKFGGIKEDPETGRYVIRNNKLKGAVMLSLEHESNGKADLDSRSWNYINVSIKYFYNMRLSAKAQAYLPYVDGEHNKDMLRYKGYGNFSINYIDKKNLWWFSLEIVPRDKIINPNIHTSLSFRVSKNSNQYLTLDYYAGYGEGLLNYKEYTNQIRIGFTIKPDFFSAY